MDISFGSALVMQIPGTLAQSAQPSPAPARGAGIAEQGIRALLVVRRQREEPFQLQLVRAAQDIVGADVGRESVADPLGVDSPMQKSYGNIPKRGLSQFSDFLPLLDDVTR